MFISHNDGKTTTTIKVEAGKDLAWASAFLTGGTVAVLESIAHPILYRWPLSIGLLLVFAGIGLGDRSLRLVYRAWRTYDKASSWKDR